MDTTTKDAVVVGVSGPGRETAALRYAVDCARRDGSEVVAVHAFRTALTGPPPRALLTFAETADMAHWVIKQVGDELSELTNGTVPFRALAVAGTPAHVLVDLGREARMVVVQHHLPHGLRRLFAGSTAYAVAAHADCPVVSVPADWQPATDVPGEVFVGVHEGGVPLAVLEAAFTQAEATGAPLRVVHAWRLDAVYDDIITDRVAAEWRAEQQRALTAVVDGLRARHPEVEVTVEVRHQWPTDVLVDDSQVASLVVVGRHGPHAFEPAHLGSLARTVVREARSPVMVVPVRPHRDAPQDWELVADEISPQA